MKTSEQIQILAYYTVFNVYQKVNIYRAKTHHTKDI